MLIAVISNYGDNLLRNIRRQYKSSQRDRLENVIRFYGNRHPFPWYLYRICDQLLSFFCFCTLLQQRGVTKCKFYKNYPQYHEENTCVCSFNDISLCILRLNGRLLPSFGKLHRNLAPFSSRR